MNKLLQVLLVIVSLRIQVQAQKISTKDWKQIEDILQAQEKAWNRGDLDGFMEPYWKSDSLKFIGKNGIVYGWKNTLQNYRRSYPEPDAMGQLSFTILHTEVLSSSAIAIIGKWSLTRKNHENLAGYFTLIWKKIKGKWVIVSDHSS